MESGSRYGIIKDLTDKKNNLLQQISDMDQNFSMAEMRLKRQQEDHGLAKENIAKQKETIKQQIAALDESIAAIQMISKEKE